MVYSALEYELTMDGLTRKLGWTPELIRSAEQNWTTHETLMMKIVFNRTKKTPNDVYAQILCKPVEDAGVETIQQDIHYGLFILGTEKHESRRIDNQLRGRAGRQ